jgi:uncharacterized membrane protein
MIPLRLVLLIFSVVCLLLATINYQPQRVNLLALGILLFVCTFLIQ